MEENIIFSVKWLKHGYRENGKNDIHIRDMTTKLEVLHIQEFIQILRLHFMDSVYRIT